MYAWCKFSVKRPKTFLPSFHFPRLCSYVGCALRSVLNSPFRIFPMIFRTVWSSKLILKRCFSNYIRHATHCRDRYAQVRSKTYESKLFLLLVIQSSSIQTFWEVHIKRESRIFSKHSITFCISNAHREFIGTINPGLSHA